MRNAKCPKCGCEEIVQGKQTGQGKMIPINKLSFIVSSNVIADICTACGYIIESRVEKPEIFK